MAIRTICPSCRTVYNLADHLAGKTVRCKKCEAAVAVGAAKDEIESRRSAIAREKTQARPPRRMRAKEDEEEEWSPPIRRSNHGLIIGLIGCGAALVVLLVGSMLVLFFFLSTPSSPSNSSPDLRADVGDFIGDRRPMGNRLPDFPAPADADDLPNADPVTRALHKVKSPIQHVQMEGLRQLKSALPDEHRAEVVKALEPLINDPNLFTRKWAVEALGVWADKDTVPILLKAMRDGDTRREAIKALGRLKDERAVEPIAERLEDRMEMHEAGDALKAMGPMAENAVLARLKHNSWFVRIMVCEVLQKIGTAKSIPALEKAEANDFSIKIQAGNAIKAIKSRQ